MLNTSSLLIFQHGLEELGRRGHHRAGAEMANAVGRFRKPYPGIEFIDEVTAAPERQGPVKHTFQCITLIIHVKAEGAARYEHLLLIFDVDEDGSPIGVHGVVKG